MQYLSEFNAKKAALISKLSFAFNLYGGFFYKENENEVFVKFNFLFNDGLKLFLRDENYTDVETFFNLFLNQEFKIVLDSISKRSKSKVFTILNIGSNAGMYAIYFKKYFKRLCLINVTTDENDFKQMKKNLFVNKIYSSTNYSETNKLNCLAFFTKKLNFHILKYILKNRKISSIDILNINELDAFILFSNIYFKKIACISKCIIVEHSNDSQNKEFIRGKLHEYFTSIHENSNLIIARN